MRCFYTAKKAFFYGTSLAVILLISSKLVSACQSVVCDNGVKSDICSIEINKNAAEWYLNFTLLILIAVSVFYFARKRKGLLTIILCVLATFSPLLLRYLRGNGSCDFLATEIAKWLFYLSLLCLSYQIISLFLLSKKLKTKLS